MEREVLHLYVLRVVTNVQLIHETDRIVFLYASATVIVLFSSY